MTLTAEPADPRATPSPASARVTSTAWAVASLSIHAYSPPLWRMGQYAIAPDGEMRRVSVSYAEELRPLTE